MSTLTPSVDSALVRPARTSALLRGPLPVWAALFVNVLTFSNLPTAVPIPGSVAQMITQGALVLAVLLALVANPGGGCRVGVAGVADVGLGRGCVGAGVGGRGGSSGGGGIGVVVGA